MDFDIRTAILGLASGNLVSGLILLLFQLDETPSRRIPFLATGKLLQASGWLLLYSRGALPDWLSFTVGNIVLIIGTSYDSWAMYWISQRPVSRSLQAISAVTVIGICTLAMPLTAAARVALTSITVMVFFALGARTMLRGASRSMGLRHYIGWSMALMAVITSVRGLWAMLAPEHFTLFSANSIQLIMFATLYYLMLTNGFGMLLLAKQLDNRELRESEARFRLAFENSNIGMCLVDTQGNLLKVNHQMSKIFGYSQAELEGMHVNDLATAEYMAVSPKVIQQAVENRADHAEFEKEYTHKQGRSVWGQVSSSLVRSIEGDPLYFISHVLDITDRKYAEEALRASEARFRSYFELPLIGIAITSLEKGWLDVNDKLCAMLGYTNAELRQRTWAELTHPNDIEADLAQFNRLLAGEIDGYDLEKRFVHKDGRTIFTHLAVHCVRRPDHSADYVVALLEDITERKQTEAALQKSEARYQDLYEHAPDMYLSVDPQTKLVLRCNQTVVQITGFAKDEIIDHPIFELYHPDCWEQARQAMHTLTSIGFVHDVELQVRCKDGRRLDVSLNMSAVRDASGQIVQSRSSWRDISARKRLEEQMQQQARTDVLTGICNRRYFIDLATSEVSRALRLSRPLTIVLIDLDHFKQINDTYGHAAGDQVLIWFVGVCQKHSRSIDIFARLGGDEFVLLLPETSDDQAYDVVERIRLRLNAQPIDLDGNLISVTISSGIASASNECDSLDALLICADQALYRAKEAGRNCVELQR